MDSYRCFWQLFDFLSRTNRTAWISRNNTFTVIASDKVNIFLHFDFWLSACDANFGGGAASKLESPTSQFTAEVRLPQISTWPKIWLFVVVIFDCGHFWLWSLHDARFSTLLEHTGAPIPTKYFWRAPPTFGSRARSHKKRSGVQQRCVSSWAWLHGSGFLTTMSDLF